MDTTKMEEGIRAFLEGLELGPVDSRFAGDEIEATPARVARAWRDDLVSGTTIKTRVIAHNQQVVRFDKENRQRTAGAVLGDLLNFLRDAVRNHHAVIVSDYKKGMISPGLIRVLVAGAKKAGKLVAVDPKVGHFSFYRGVSIITPNLAEASQGSGVEIRDEKSLIKAGKQLKRKLACEAVLITRGDQGMSLFEKSMVTHIPTVARHVYDVTGAGDTKA